MSSNFIRCRDFKGFKELNLDILPITVLTGLNCGGKTSVIQAMLLAKWAKTKIDRNESQVIGKQLCGIPIGEPADLIEFGQVSAKIEAHIDGSDVELNITDDGISAEAKAFKFDHYCQWRIVSSVALALSSLHEVGDSHLDDVFMGNLHSLRILTERALKRVPDSMHQGLYFLSAVEDEISKIVGSTQIRSNLINEATVQLQFKGKRFEEEFVPPEQFGAGVSAVLPLVIHVCHAKPGETLIVQDPEKHLHPKGQSAVGRLLARAAAFGVQVVVETHSEHVVSGIKLGLLQENVELSSTLSCLYLDRSTEGDLNVHHINFDDLGRTIEWPKGYFDQSTDDFKEFMKGRK